MQQAHREEDSEAMSVSRSTENDDDERPRDRSRHASKEGMEGLGDTAAGGEETEDANGKKKDTDKEKDPMGRLLTYISPGDGKYYVLGVVCGGLTGIGKGLFGLLMMRTMTALAPADPNQIRADGLFWSISFISLGCITMVLETI